MPSSSRLVQRIPVLALVPGAALLVASCVIQPRTRPFPDAGLHLGPRTTDARFDVEVAQTANGLRYAIVPDRRSNIVTVDVRYTVGAADDPDGKSGLAHLVEHVIFSHTPTGDGPSLSQRLDQAALAYNAYTNWDETHYMSTALTSSLDAVLALEAERMAPSCDRLSVEVFERERQVVLNESRERTDDIWRAVRDRLFGTAHPYARPVGGTDITALTRDDVCGFLAAHYAPSRAILVIVGPVDVAATRALVEKRFAGIQRTPAAQREMPAITTTGESVHSADVEKPTAVIAFPAPPWGKKGNAGRDLVIDLWIRRAQSSADTTGITGIERGYLGGYRGGVDLITVTASHWSKLPGAVDAVFRARDTILADEFTLSRRNTRSSHVNGHLGSLEAFSGMGVRVADYLQYSDHPWFMIQPFNEAEAMWPEGLVVKVRTINGYAAPRLVDHADEAPQLRLAIDALPTRAGTHVAWIRPDKRGLKMESTPTAVPRIEVAEWKAPVETGDASKPVPLPPAPTRIEPQKVVLRNGLTVVLAPVARSPLVDIRVVFPAGTLSDPAQRPGVAMLAAHLLDHSVPNDLTQDEFTRAFWALGLGTRMTADVDEDTTVFRATGAARYADWHMWRLFWMLDQGAYDTDALERLRKDVKAAEHPSLAALLATALVGPAAVHDPDPTSMRRISRYDLQRFRDEHYLPKGATLIITGGFDMQTMVNALPLLWGRWYGQAPRVKYPKLTGAPTGQRQLAIDDDDARQLTVALAFPASTKDIATRIVVEEMVAGQVRSVRGRLGVTYGVAAEYEVLVASAPALLVTGEVDPNRGGEAIKAMLAALDELRNDGTAFTRAFVAARRRVVGRLAARISDTPAVAGELEALARSGWSRGDVDDLLASVARLTPVAAREAIARDMARDKAVMALSGRRAAVEQAYRDAGMPAPHFAPSTSAVSAR